LKKIYLIFFSFFIFSAGFAQPCDELSALCSDSMQFSFYETICDWIGTPYNYSGDSKDGIDCSGFVSMLYKRVYNVELGASSKAIFSKDVEPLLKKNLNPADLVFFRIHKKRVSHVGVYLGDNKFVHATVKQGVIISDLNEPYYKKYFYKGGRLKDLTSTR
jgi:lipoprotein Spr